MKSLKITLSKTWNDLNQWQLLKVVKILHHTPPGKAQDKALLKIAMNLRFWHFLKKAKLNLLLANVPISEIKQDLNFIFTENDRTVFPGPVKIKGTTYHPPMDRIINLDASEFAAALDINNKFLQTRNPEYLTYLAAILYTPLPRPKFDKLKLEANAKPFNKLSEIKLIAIHLCFSGCTNTIAKRFKKAFPKSNSKQKPKYGFGKVILQMCRQDLSKYDKIAHTNIYRFLEQFQDDIEQSSKNKK